MAKILLPVTERGGFGDVVASLNMGMHLERAGHKIYVEFKGLNAVKKFEKIAPKNKWEKYSPLDMNKNDTLVNVSCVNINTGGYYPKAHSIFVSEYNMFFNSGADISVRTGIYNISTAEDAVPSGIYTMGHLDDIIRKIESAPDRKALKKQLAERISDAIGVELPAMMLSNALWCADYSSTEYSSHKLASMLANASGKIKDDAVLFVFAHGFYGEEHLSSYSSTKDIISAAKSFGFGYPEFNGTKAEIVEGKIKGKYIIPVNAMPYDIFTKMLMLCELPCSVIGDLSLSEMLHKSESGIASPFFYSIVTWKRALGNAIKKLAGNTDKDAAMLLRRYAEISCETADCDKKMFCPASCPEIAQMSRLFYDKEMIERFNAAEKSIRQQMIDERKKYKHAETLQSAEKTVEFLVQQLENGMSPKDAAKEITCRKKRLFGIF